MTLLHCDLVYTAANTQFRMPFAPLGIVQQLAGMNESNK